MPDWKLMRESIRAARGEGTFGDAALLKLAGMGAAPDSAKAAMARVRGYRPQVRIEDLRALPEGTFGRAYAHHLDDNGIELFEFTPAVEARMAKEHPFALRYTVTHDMVHALTGFDTGLAGEAGVYAFTVGQGAAPAGRWAMNLLRVVYPVLSPSQAFAIWNNVKVGQAMGEKARMLIAEPLESMFEQPLHQVRAHLGLPDPAEAGVMGSRPSWLAKLTYSKLLDQEPPPVAEERTLHQEAA